MATALLVAGSTLTFLVNLGRLRLHPPAHSQASVKALGRSYNCVRLTCGSFQLTHMSRDNHVVQLIESWRPKRSQNVITALTTLPQGRISTRKHQCTTAITTMWTESSWAFPESYTTGSCARAMADNDLAQTHFSPQLLDMNHFSVCHLPSLYARISLHV